MMMMRMMIRAGQRRVLPRGGRGSSSREPVEGGPGEGQAGSLPAKGRQQSQGEPAACEIQGGVGESAPEPVAQLSMSRSHTRWDKGSGHPVFSC